MTFSLISSPAVSGLSGLSAPAHAVRMTAARDGLNLGEACGAVLLSSEGTEEHVILSGGAVSNDANHISGPSRTGDGLYFAIRQAMQEAGTAPQDISFVNAHGTATVYNDEMESKALTLAHLEQVPVHSLKPYFGHTLGASGIIESIVCMHELKQGILFGTPGYENAGSSYADTGLCHPPEHPDETLRKNRFGIRRMQRSHCLIFTGIYSVQR